MCGFCIKRPPRVLRRVEVFQFVNVIVKLPIRGCSEHNRSESHTRGCSQRRGGRRDGCYYHLQQHIPKSLVLHNLVSSFMFQVSKINCQLSIVHCQFQKSCPARGRTLYNVQCSTFNVQRFSPVPCRRRCWTW